MKYTYRVTIECPDREFYDGPPSKRDVAEMLREYALFYGGGCWYGDDSSGPDPRFTLYQHGRVREFVPIR